MWILPHCAAFQYETKHLWHNFGILIVFFFAFQVMAMIAIEATQGIVFLSIVIFERENKERKKLNERRGELEQDIKGLVRTRKPFTWERLSYTVPVSGGHKRLLNEVYRHILVRCILLIACSSFHYEGAEHV